MRRRLARLLRRGVGHFRTLHRRGLPKPPNSNAWACSRQTHSETEPGEAIAGPDRSRRHCDNGPGGIIQCRVPLNAGRRPLDASTSRKVAPIETGFPPQLFARELLSCVPPHRNHSDVVALAPGLGGLGNLVGGFPADLARSVQAEQFALCVGTGPATPEHTVFGARLAGRHAED